MKNASDTKISMNAKYNKRKIFFVIIDSQISKMEIR